MLSAQKLKELCQLRQMNAASLGSHIATGGRDIKEASKAVKNWQRGLFKPKPSQGDIKKLAGALGVEPSEITDWKCSYKYAPLSARKARLVTQLIAGRSFQDAVDVLKFTHKRAAHMVVKLLKCAAADADEQQANVENLYVKEARVDEAGIRVGTKRWIAKDRGRAHPIRKTGCHIYVTLTQE
jgi:large subunit ribosomal protein L22